MSSGHVPTGSSPEETTMASNEPPAMRFEDALAHLERAVHDLEEGQLSLDEALERFAQGVGWASTCQNWLEHAEHRVRILTVTTEVGTTEATSLCDTKPAGEESVSAKEPTDRSLTSATGEGAFAWDPEPNRPRESHTGKAPGTPSIDPPW